MAILNVTYRGRSADLPGAIDDRTGDRDAKRFAVEVMRSGECAGMHEPDLRANAFDHFVIDRITDPAGVLRLYLRPKVPFGDC